MKSAYANYKEWWLEHRAKDYQGLFWGYDPEEGWEKYWNHLSAYKRYEKLEDWLNNQEIPEGN